MPYENTCTYAVCIAGSVLTSETVAAQGELWTARVVPPTAGDGRTSSWWALSVASCERTTRTSSECRQLRFLTGGVCDGRQSNFFCCC